MYVLLFWWLIFNKHLWDSVYTVLVILQRKRRFKRNLGSPVKNCPRAFLICLSESVRRGLILPACDIYWRIVRNANKDKIGIEWIDLKWISPRSTFDITVDRSFSAFLSRINEDGAKIEPNLLTSESILGQCCHVSMSLFTLESNLHQCCSDTMTLFTSESILDL